MGLKCSRPPPHFVLLTFGDRASAARLELFDSMLDGAPTRYADPHIGGMDVRTGVCVWRNDVEVKVTTWSIGGSDRVRPLWSTWGAGATAIVLALGSGPDWTSPFDDDGLISELQHLGKMEWTSDCPLYIVYNQSGGTAGAERARSRDVHCQQAYTQWPGARGKWAVTEWDSTSGRGAQEVMQWMMER
jgi:hypothetical protein